MVKYLNIRISSERLLLFFRAGRRAAGRRGGKASSALSSPLSSSMCIGSWTPVGLLRLEPFQFVTSALLL